MRVVRNPSTVSEAARLLLHSDNQTMLLFQPLSFLSFPATPTVFSFPVVELRAGSRSQFNVSAAAKDVDSFTEKSGYLFDLTEAEAESLSEYNVYRIAAIYRRRPLILLRRLVQLGANFGYWFVARYVDEIMDRSDEMFKIRAAELRKILTELGPAYIKIAQAVSSRPDIVPPSYLGELSLLQDRISPFSSEVAFDMIEQELGTKLDILFSEISPSPIAAASLGQVYQARLRHNGKVVAIKVQRPGVQAAISLDILILRYVAGLLKKAGRLNSDLQGVVDEWATSLFKELDYVKEARNGIKFRQLYGSIQDVVVPEFFLDYTTRKVLVMEWIEGQKLVEMTDLYLIEVGVYCSFNQLLEYGFYHADPHPGNFLRTNDGKLAYLDFGMMGEMEQELRDGFIETCLHLVNRDFQALAKDFITLGLLPPTAEREAITEALTGVFRSALAKGVRNIGFGDLLGDLGTTMYNFKFRIPPYFSLVIRSLAVLEGIAISINPKYKVLSSTYPWVARKVLTNSSPQLKKSLQALLYEKGVFRIDRLESLLSESLRARTEQNSAKNLSDHAQNRVIIKQIINFTLTEKGSFVREILLQEFAKGLDAIGLATLDSFSSATSASIPPFTGMGSFSSLTEEDIMNLRTLQRLMLLLRGVKSDESDDKDIKPITPYKAKSSSTEVSLLLYEQLEPPPVQELLPVLSIIPELPPEAQQQLLQLPADLAGRLFSRAVARTMRRIFL